MTMNRLVCIRGAAENTGAHDMLDRGPKSSIIAALLLAASLVTASWGRANERAVEFNIPPQALGSALLIFAKQAEVQVSVSTTVIAGMKTPGVVGKFTPSVALTRLLVETDLRFSTVGERTYAVAEEKASDNAQPSQAPSPPTEASTSPATPAAASVGTAEGAKKKNPGNDANDELNAVELGDLVVTGTYIRRAEPVGGQLITIERADIDRSGFSTTQDVIRALPQNFGGGPSEDTQLGLEASTNAAKSTALNLRGLGAGATLVLVNGRRLAVAGSEGTFTDVSSIPLSAVERIEILTDGASAMYGSDAVGGVVNFILHKDYRGAETQLQLGSVTEGSLNEQQLGQALGTAWDSGGAYLSYEYYQRDSLPAADRALAANSDLTSLGGDDFSSIEGNPGNIIAGGEIWAVPRGQDGRSLQPADFVAGTFNLQNLNEGRDLLPEQRRHSAFGAISQALGPSAEIFLESLYAQRDADTKLAGLPLTLLVPSSNPFYVNPTGDVADIDVPYNFFDDLGPRTFSVEVKTSSTALGVTYDPGKNWRTTLVATYGVENVRQSQGNSVDFNALVTALADPDPATAFNPFGDGSFTNPATLEAIRTDVSFRTDSVLRSANFIATGPLLRLPGGELSLAIGADHRQQSFESLSTTVNGASGADFDRRTSAFFSEVVAPLIGQENRRSGLEQLEVSLAGRYDNYDDFGSTTNPKFSARWSPVNGLVLRGTWGTSFKAPNLADLDETNNGSFIFPMPDPLAPSGESPTLFWFGKNADLTEETATTWTLSTKLVPPSLPGFSVELSYYNIEYEDRIQEAPFVLSFLTDEQRYAAIVTRNPTAEERAVVCSRSTFFGDPADCLSSPIAAIIDARTNNTSIVKNTGIDLLGSYSFDTDVGRFDLDMNATYALDYSQRQTPTAPKVELLDRVNNPVRFRARSSLSWSRLGFSTAAFLNYSDSYHDNLSVPNRKIDSWVTADIQLSYETDAAQSQWSRGISVALTVRNLLDEDPPFVNNGAGGIGYDAENADLLGRFVNLRFRKEWGAGKTGKE